MKAIKGILKPEGSHWVGNGFPVRNLFSYNDYDQALSPFLLLDYAGPKNFEPTHQSRGVGQHPHRGFETVTIVYQGEVDHRDSSGGGGHIGPGDVQWMTAASGILHDEFHSPAFRENGGVLEMIQLWVNLPAKDKMSEPRYQTLENANIPKVNLVNDAGWVRVIAGEFQGNVGPAVTVTPINLWDIKLNTNNSLNLKVEEGHSVLALVLKGTASINQSEQITEAELAVLTQKGQEVLIEASQDSQLLIMSGEPINEPVFGYGPFVMNTKEEIIQAINDFS